METLSKATQPSAAESTIMDIRSQTPPEQTHRQRLLRLQQRHQPGLWAECDSCCKWRFLPHVLDRHELPDKWICSMNPDTRASDCSIPEEPNVEEDMIYSEYAAGSLVWAKVQGYPWWPAMVDDCPDVENYYWLDDSSNTATHYNVVFFDTSNIERAWIPVKNLKPFISNQKIIKNVKKLNNRLLAAFQLAKGAANMRPQKRLAQFSFCATYTGYIHPPKQISKRELKKFVNKLKRQASQAAGDEPIKTKHTDNVQSSSVGTGHGRNADLKETVSETFTPSDMSSNFWDDADIINYTFTYSA